MGKRHEKGYGFYEGQIKRGRENHMNYLYRIFCYLKRKSIRRTIIKGGGTIGKKTILSDPNSGMIDVSRPWLLTIGDYCVISKGVIILTHDYSLSTLRRVYGEWIGEGRETTIGNNCFIGMNAILLMGTKLGDNVIVGAGSVVRGVFEDNVVIAGNPARVICKLEEFYQKRKEKTVQEALECAEVFRKKNKCEPSPSDLSGFKFLFCPRNKETVKKYGLSFSCSADEPKEVENEFYLSKPYWDDFQTFLDESKKIMKETH